MYNVDLTSLLKETIYLYSTFSPIAADVQESFTQKIASFLSCHYWIIYLMIV